MKRVETSEATTSLGAEGVGPAVWATPPEPGVTWSAVLGVSEGEGGAGRATSLGGEEERRRRRKKEEGGSRGVGLGERGTRGRGGKMGGDTGSGRRRGVEMEMTVKRKKGRKQKKEEKRK